MPRASHVCLHHGIAKTVYHWDGSAWRVVASRKFIWTGWMLLMELDGLNSDAGVRTYAWGLDLAGWGNPATSRGAALQNAGIIHNLLG